MTSLTSTLGRALALLLVTFSFSVAMLGVTLESYRAKVTAARDVAVELETSLRNKQSSDVRSFTARLRRDFSSSGPVEWKGGTVDTSNDWLLGKARALDEAASPADQLPLVVELREHLSSISFKLNELSTAAAAERSKDEDKRKLSEILQREEYQKPQEKHESLFQRWLRAFLEWLESLLPKSGPAVPSAPGSGIMTMIFQLLLYGGLLALLGFLAYKVVPLIFPKLKRSRKPKKKKDRIILGEHLGDDVTSKDLLTEAERLAREGNLRGAIRKGYIAMLCELSDRKVIGLAHNKTNRDYLRDVRSRRDLHPRMKVITDTFENHWYGLQDSAEQDWARFREDYKEAIRSI
jgi:hypothetical protein